MTIEGGEKGLLLKILNKQFMMIGETMRMEKLPEDGMIEVQVGKKSKKMMWYEHYMWDSMEQYKEWRKWAWSELLYLGESKAQYILDYADLRYGLIVRLKKEGTLF